MLSEENWQDTNKPLRATLVCVNKIKTFPQSKNGQKWAKMVVMGRLWVQSGALSVSIPLLTQKKKAAAAAPEEKGGP